MQSRKRGSGGEAPNNFLIKLFLPQENAHFGHRDSLFIHEKAVVNERAKMKEIRQNDGKIKVQDDNITENINARFNIQKFLYVVACVQSQKTQRKLERHFV